MAPQFDIIFMPHKDYHSKAMYAIAKALTARGVSWAFLEPVERHKDGQAREALKGQPVPWIENDNFTSTIRSPKAVVVMNDWDMASSHLLDHCKLMGIEIIGLQEGTTDFLRQNWDNPGYADQNRLPYTKADFLLLASEFDATYFPKRPTSIIGMDRVEPLFHEEVTFPPKPIVLINVNFSYKVCLEFSRDWLTNCVEACDKLGFDYVISVHPQDETNLTGYEENISTEPLHELLKRTTLFLSRFSNAIYESLALGKPVVYYNPHGEGSRTFNEAEGAFSVVSSKDALTESIAFEAEQRSIRDRAKPYLTSHLSIQPERNSADRASAAISDRLAEKAVLKEQNRPADQGKVSILIPVYNVADYLDRCLDSVLNQTYENIEVVIVDDASTDRSLEIAEEYAAKDNRIVIIPRQLNLGVSAARNLALARATGVAILFVDPDDWIAPETCEKTISKLQENNSDVCVFSMFDFDMPKSIERVHHNWSQIESGEFDKIEFMRICSPCTKMYSAQFLRKTKTRFPEGLVFEDWFWSLQWSTQTDNVSAIPDTLYFYRRNRPDSITSGQQKEIDNMRSIVRNLAMSKSFLDCRNADYRPLAALIDKSDARLLRSKDNIVAEEWNRAYGILGKYLVLAFPDGLPPSVSSNTVRAAFNTEQKMLRMKSQ